MSKEDSTSLLTTMLNKRCGVTSEVFEFDPPELACRAVVYGSFLAVQPSLLLLLLTFSIAQPA